MAVPPFNVSQPLVGPDGYATKPFRDWIAAVTTQLNAAQALAANAVPNTRNIVAAGGLHVGGSLANDVGLALYRAVCPVAALPTVGNAQGDFAYAVNGRKAAETAGNGTGVPCFWNSGAWVAVDSGATVTA